MLRNTAVTVDICQRKRQTKIGMPWVMLKIASEEVTISCFAILFLPSDLDVM